MIRFFRFLRFFAFWPCVHPRFFSTLFLNFFTQYESRDIHSHIETIMGPNGEELNHPRDLGIDIADWNHCRGEHGGGKGTFQLKLLRRPETPRDIVGAWPRTPARTGPGGAQAHTLCGNRMSDCM